jgi:hypothetical protein
VQTITGQAVDLLDPRPDTIRKHDIAFALGRTQRFNGHTEAPYSVAQHSVLVARLVTRAMPNPSPRLMLAALLHDAHEAYMGDIATPVARLPGFKAPVAQLKARLQGVIHRAFWLPAVLPAEWRAAIKHADLVALATEKRDLLGPEPRPWAPLPEPAGDDVAALLRRGALNGFAAMVTALADEMRTCKEDAA